MVSVLQGGSGRDEWRRLLDARRLVTVLFCDVVGSTALSSRQVDAEDWAEIINGAFPLMIEPVERYDGHVARLIGHAILAFFGAPTAHEDDPERAIHAALNILDAISSYRDQVHADYGLDFNVRIGINTGEVVTGSFGAHGASEYTAMGDEVNLASRLQQAAEPGTILVSASTYGAARARFEFAPLEPIEVKGLDQPVQSFRVLGRAAGSKHLQDQVPLVGRHRELELLQ